MTAALEESVCVAGSAQIASARRGGQHSCGAFPGARAKGNADRDRWR